MSSNNFDSVLQFASSKLQSATESRVETLENLLKGSVINGGYSLIEKAARTELAMRDWADIGRTMHVAIAEWEDSTVLTEDQKFIAMCGASVVELSKRVEREKEAFIDSFIKVPSSSSQMSNAIDAIALENWTPRWERFEQMIVVIENRVADLA